MSDISLSKAVRSNLLSLQNTADMMATTQNRLATGKKVNSALDNPTNFFTASSLNSRAGDINQLLDGMANGIQTLEAADNGLKAITKTLESMQSTLRQARQDKSFETISLSVNDLAKADTLDFAGGALGEAGLSVDIAEFVTAGEEGTPAVPAVPGDPANPDDEGTPGTPAIPGTPASADIDEIVRAINGDEGNNGAIRASNDNGKLRIENLSTQRLTIEGTAGEGGDAETTALGNVDGNSVRAGLADQFRELRDQLDKIADDASFNGINLLRGDNLQITFNETGTSELNIRSKDEQGISSTVLELETNLQAQDLDSDTDIDSLLDDVKSAINEVRSQASAFGSSLSIVQNRQDFSKNMINTLQTGAANLTLADSNEEAANLLALQTRQQLSSTALSMASQQDQSVLRLF